MSGRLHHGNQSRTTNARSRRRGHFVQENLPRTVHGIRHFKTGEVEIETLGKNPMASKKPGMSVWEALDYGKRRDLTSQDKFMLLSPDAMLREGIEEETAFVFTLKVSKNPLRQVFGADSTDRPPLPPSQSPSPSPSPLSS